MRIFIFEDVEQLTDNYHSGGGLNVIASDIEHAKRIIAQSDNIEITDEEWASVISYEIVGEAEPRLIEFPDAGCC